MPVNGYESHIVLFGQLSRNIYVEFLMHIFQQKVQILQLNSDSSGVSFVGLTLLLRLQEDCRGSCCLGPQAWEVLLTFVTAVLRSWTEASKTMG